MVKGAHEPDQAHSRGYIYHDNAEERDVYVERYMTMGFEEESECTKDGVWLAPLLLADHCPRRAVQSVRCPAAMTGSSTALRCARSWRPGAGTGRRQRRRQRSSRGCPCVLVIDSSIGHCWAVPLTASIHVSIRASLIAANVPTALQAVALHQPQLLWRRLW